MKIKEFHFLITSEHKYLPWRSRATKILISIFFSRNICKNNQSITKGSKPWDEIAGLERCHNIHLDNTRQRNLPEWPIRCPLVICPYWSNFDRCSPSNNQECIILHVMEGIKLHIFIKRYTGTYEIIVLPLFKFQCHRISLQF